MPGSQLCMAAHSLGIGWEQLSLSNPHSSGRWGMRAQPVVGGGIQCGVHGGALSPCGSGPCHKFGPNAGQSPWGRDATEASA